MGIGRLGLVAASQPSLVAQALAILAKYGSAANLYLPGVGAINGLQAGNWLDNIGATAATVDNPVGLVVSAGKSVGPELFSVASVGGGVTNNGGTLSVNSVAVGSAIVTSNVALIVGKYYKVTFTVSGYSGGGVSIRAGTTGSAGAVVGAMNGTFTEVFSPAISSDNFHLMARYATTTLTVSNISVRELPGAHLTQATTANKPILRRGLVNQLLQSRDYATTWSVIASGATVASNVAIAPDGTTTADALVEVSGVTYGFNQATSVSGAATFAVIAKAGAKQFVYLQPNSGGAYFNLSTGIIGHVGAFCTGASIAQIGNGWYLCVINFASNSNPLQIYAAPAGGINSAGYTGVAGVRAIYLSDSAVFSGTLTAQQIIDAGGIPTTTTAPASSTNGPFAWQFDGSNDSFTSTLTTGNEGWVCAGVKFGGAANETIAESGATAGAATNKGIWLFRWGGVGLEMRVGNGVSITSQGLTSVPLIGIPRVIEGGWDASSIFVGADGVIASKARTGDASPAGSVLRIGAYQGVTNYLNGLMSATIIMPTVLPTATERATLRQFIASLSGVTM